MQFLKNDSIVQRFIYTFDDETMTIDQIIYLKFEQFLLNMIIDSINCQFIVYEKFDATHQKIDQKVNVFKIYLKKIERKLFSFDDYYKIILFLIKLISVLKNKLFIIKNVSNIKKIILFKIIMQKIILSRMREDDTNNNNQHKNNKFFDNQFNRDQQFDKVRHFNKFEKKDKLNNHFNAQTNNKRTYVEMKNEKNNCYFKYYK